MAFYIRQNDTSPALSATLTDYDDNPINLTGASVKIHVKDLSGVSKVNASCVVTNAPEGLVSYAWNSSDTDTPGTYYLEFEVTYSDTSIETFPNKGNLSIVVTKELS